MAHRHAYDFLLELPGVERDPGEKPPENRNLGRGRQVAAPSGLSVGDWDQDGARRLCGCSSFTSRAGGLCTTCGHHTNLHVAVQGKIACHAFVCDAEPIERPRTADDEHEEKRAEAQQAMSRAHAEQLAARADVRRSVAAALDTGKRKAEQEARFAKSAKSRMRWLDPTGSGEDDDTDSDSERVYPNPGGGSRGDADASPTAIAS